MKSALSEVTVLDLTQRLAGPYASMILADLGATVIKVEPPEGDETRTIPPYLNGESTYFLSINRNKRSIVINLKTEEGIDIFYKLVRKADVVFDNFRPGVTTRLKIDYERLKEINPRIITCSITSFGPDGPYRDKPAYDLIVQALSGGMSVTGEPGRPPVSMGFAVGDLSAGQFAVQGILAALIARQQSGKGQHVDISLLDSLIALQAYHSGYYLQAGKVSGPSGSGHPYMVVYQSFPTEDGYIVVIGHRAQFWTKFCQAIERPELESDDRFASMEQRVAHKQELIALVEQILRHRPTRYWVETFEANGVPVAPINSIGEALEDIQVKHRHMVMEMDHPAVGLMRCTGNPVKMSGSPGKEFTPPPLLGQHSEDILQHYLGLEGDKVRELKIKRIVG